MSCRKWSSRRPVSFARTGLSMAPRPYPAPSGTHAFARVVQNQTSFLAEITSLQRRGFQGLRFAPDLIALAQLGRRDRTRNHGKAVHSSCEPPRGCTAGGRACGMASGARRAAVTAGDAGRGRRGRSGQDGGVAGRRLRRVLNRSRPARLQARQDQRRLLAHDALPRLRHHPGAHPLGEPVGHIGRPPDRAPLSKARGYGTLDPALRPTEYRRACVLVPRACDLCEPCR